jgi:hypothetical protein
MIIDIQIPGGLPVPYEHERSLAVDGGVHGVRLEVRAL